MGIERNTYLLHGIHKYGLKY